LGEITALAACGVISESLAIEISAKRGELMDEAASSCDGGMMAVLLLATEEIESLISELELSDKVVIANDNAPNQIVVSGDKSAFDILSKKIAEEGGRCKKLNVSGPWHSPYLKSAREKFKAWSEPIEFRKPHTPILFNATASLESDPLTIKKLITLQLSSPVYFRQCMQYCKLKAMDSFFEIGPGRVLSGLVRANGFMQGVRVYNINNLRGIEAAAAEILA
jgi:[acyl-carrier-protein] S-malonyltransferase